MLDPAELLSPYSIRAVSRSHADHPYILASGRHDAEVAHEPAESRIGLFEGNSNRRGPIWFPVNYLIVWALQKFHRHQADL
jgi:hypothetical protein